MPPASDLPIADPLRRFEAWLAEASEQDHAFRWACDRGI